MLHSTATSPAIRPVGPSGPGAIAGFEVACEACGFTFRSSLRTIAEGDAREHVAYMLRKEQGRKGR
jgi:hypothetical protein